MNFLSVWTTWYSSSSSSHIVQLPHQFFFFIFTERLANLNAVHETALETDILLWRQNGISFTLHYLPCTISELNVFGLSTALHELHCLFQVSPSIVPRKQNRGCSKPQEHIRQRHIRLWAGWDKTVPQLNCAPAVHTPLLYLTRAAADLAIV